MGFCDISARGIPLTALAYAIMLRLHRSVRDATGFTGRYDFDVRFTPDEVLTLAVSRPPGLVRHAIGSDGKDIDPNGPSLMTGLREQLGLKLDAETGPVEALVIDSAERPTPIRTACERRRLRGRPLYNP